jgi:DNA (cytosine-5)-methyltransferase 1|tara:strand:+ start:411 stop:1406 length:996 start_codon:yes stop_codon:yes gene_type:complete
MNEYKFPYEWTLKDAVFTKDKGTVFSCFACGGGSTMGYKLAGFDVLGCNEIDPKMIEAYRANHKPKYSFLEPIQDFKNKKDLPKELFNLDILDGSPPCSSFSMAGLREKAWGKQKKFREGQALQILDTLFFDFIDLAERLQPKVVIGENVKGLLLGNAKEYVEKIYKAFDKAGFICQHFLLKGSDMGVPQGRERVFFVCLRKDLANQFIKTNNLFEQKPYLNLDFNETPILSKEVVTKGNPISNKTSYLESRYGDILFNPDKVFNTICTRNRYFYDLKHYVSNETYLKAGTYPMDYDFVKTQPLYLTGMSVPPVMTAQVVSRVYEQWLSKI